MRRIGILTAGGDTPALNATIYGAVTRANERNIEVIGFIKGFSGLCSPHMPHVLLNPLYCIIPELTPTRGGTILGASRHYVTSTDTETIAQIAVGLRKLKIEGLICIGGDGTLNGMQALNEIVPTVLAPKTIDNDLGLNYRNEPDEWQRLGTGNIGDKPPEPLLHLEDGHWYRRIDSRARFDIERMVNYVTPGFATAVYVSAIGIQRVRTTAESHRRIAIVEVMGRHSGYIALGSSYGQPDILLVPECPINVDRLVERVKEIYEIQKNVVIVCGEGVIDEQGEELGAEFASTDPAGNKILSGASESLRSILIKAIGDDYFTSRRRNESARSAIFTRKVGHTQRGGRPILFDRLYASQLGAHSVELLVQNKMNAVAILNWNRDQGFHLSDVYANDFRDRWGLIHARKMHPSFYDKDLMRPSSTGIEYLMPIFHNAISSDDIEVLRTGTFDPSNLLLPYHSVNSDMSKRIAYLSGNDS